MYIIHETQFMGEGQLIPVEPSETREDENEAWSVYYLKKAAAAISTVPVHAVSLENEFGVQLETGFFDHRPKPTEE